MFWQFAFKWCIFRLLLIDALLLQYFVFAIYALFPQTCSLLECMLRNFVKTMQLGWERFLQVGDQEERVRERMEEERERARQYRWSDLISSRIVSHIKRILYVLYVYIHCWGEGCIGQLGFTSPTTENKELMQREITFENKNFRHSIELRFKQVGAGGDE